MGAHLTRAAVGTAGRIVIGAAALACVGAAAVSHGGDRGAVRGVLVGGDLHETRLVIDLDRSAHARINSDKDGRLIMSLASTRVAGQREGRGEGLVRAWSMENAGGAARLALTLNGPVQVRRRFLLAPEDGAPGYRYVIDLAATGPATAAVEPIAAAPQVMRASNEPVHARKVIVIDPGHGGKDPGAQGARTAEKSVTLQAAERLKAQLEKTGRYEVVLTRSDDLYVPLETRVQIARHADADLFISLHADSGSDPSLRGATVYTLSDEGSGRAARKAIDERGYFLNVGLPGQDRAVSQILLDLTQRVTKSRSSEFAESLVERLGETEPLSHRSHRDAGFVVLLAPDVPAVLLEMGFITNPEDERALDDPRRGDRLMASVARSIDDYFASQRRLASR